MLQNEIQKVKPLVDFSREYRNNEELRARIENGDYAPLDAMGVEIPEGAEVRIFCNTADTYYLPFQPDPNSVLEDNDLISISGGGSTASSFGSLACLPSCLSSGSTLGCASSE